MKLLMILKSPISWILLLGAVVIWQMRQMQHMQANLTRMGRNQVLLKESQQQLQLSNGRLATQTGVLQLKQYELNRLFPELRAEIAQLQLKPRMVQSVAATGFSLEKQFKFLLRDSITPVKTIGGDSERLRWRVFRYQDNFYDLTGYSLADTQVLRINYRDTMTQVVFYKRKHPWLWIFSKKELLQRVYFKNPNAAIYYSRIIQLQR